MIFENRGTKREVCAEARAFTAFSSGLHVSIGNTTCLYNTPASCFLKALGSIMMYRCIEAGLCSSTYGRSVMLLILYSPIFEPGNPLRWPCHLKIAQRPQTWAHTIAC